MFVSLRSAIKSATLLGILFALPAFTLAQTTTRISVGTGGAESNRNSFNPRVSADGKFVVFSSLATNLVAGDTNDEEDIFVTELATGVTKRVNVSTGGANQRCYHRYCNLRRRTLSYIRQYRHESGCQRHKHCL